MRYARAVVSWFRHDVLGNVVAGLIVVLTVWLAALVVPAIRERTADLFNSQVRVWQVVAVVIPAALLLALGIWAVVGRRRKRLSTPSLVERVEYAGALWTVQRAWYYLSGAPAVFGPFCADDGTFLSFDIDGHLIHGHSEKPHPWEFVGADTTFRCVKCQKAVYFEPDMKAVYSMVMNIGVAMPVSKK